MREGKRAWAIGENIVPLRHEKTDYNIDCSIGCLPHDYFYRYISIGDP